jgi:hypothetical protein
MPNPAETMQDAILWTGCLSSLRPYEKYKPGQLYSMLPESMKENLRNLKPEHFAVLRPEMTAALVEEGIWDYKRRRRHEGYYSVEFNPYCFSPCFYQNETEEGEKNLRRDRELNPSKYQPKNGIFT